MVKLGFGTKLGTEKKEACLPGTCAKSKRAICCKLTKSGQASGSLCLTFRGSVRVRFCLFDLILYVSSTIFQLNRDGSYWVEPLLS